tara:strand:- start:30 stop:275 length:246 start_codon:yes stop_codon:yes gene_type:complete
MHSLAPGDLVWIPANTLIEYQAYMMGRTRVPTYGLVLETKNNLWDGHATILRNNEKVSINKKDLRKINCTEEENGSVSRSC